MKSLPHRTTVHEQIDGVRLYRDDLDRILGLFGAAEMTVTISDDAFQFDSLDELQKIKGGSPRKIEISAKVSSSHDRIQLSRSGMHWYLYSTGEGSYGLAREIEAIVRSRQTTVSRLPLHWMFQAGNLLLFTGFLTRVTFAGVSPTLMALGAVALVGTMLLTCYWLLHPRVSLRYRHDAGFFRRNSDSIVLLVCGAVVGALVQYLSSLLTGQQVPPAP